MNQQQLYFTLLWSIWFVSVTTLTGQTQPNRNNYIPNIQHFSTEDGLSHREVLFIFHDRDGITWLATPNGLNRFDGYHFKHFLGRENDADFRNIGKITQDDEGWLWLIQGQEVVFFHPQTEMTQTVAERFGEDCILLNSKRPTSNLKDFQVDTEGRIYFIIDETNLIYTYHSSEGFRKKVLPQDFQKKYKRLFSISDNEELTFFLGGRTSVFSYMYGIKVHILSPNSDSTYIIKEKKFYYNSSLFNREVNQIGERWSNSTTDYYFFDANRNFLTSIEGYRKSRTDFVYLDQQENYWIATKSGFYIVEITKNKFDFIEKPTILTTADAQGMIVDSMEIMLAFQQDEVMSYNFKTNRWGTISGSFWNRGIYRSDNGIWICGSPKVSFYENGTLETFQIQDKTLKPHNFRTITPSRLNKDWLWLGGLTGLYRFNTQTKKFKQFNNKAIKGDVYCIQSIMLDKENEHWLWLCTDQGLILFDENKEVFIAHYHFNQQEEYYLPTNNIQHLFQDNNGIYWLATAHAGIIRWDKNKHDYRQFTVKDGLPTNVIFSIYPDDYGNFWMSSDYGIIRMNKSTFAIKNYLEDRGTGQIEFNLLSHFDYRDAAGNQRLYFGGLKGVTNFAPKDFQKDDTLSTLPILTLLSYQQFDSKEKEVVDKTLMIRNSQKIVLKSNDYIHQLEVGLLNYNGVESNIYHYQLNRNGEKSAWKAQKNRLIQLGQLPYGTHQLIVKANTISNLKAANELVFEIIIRRPFYLTWWFVLLATASIAGTTAYWYRRRNRQLRHRQKELETVVKERTEELQKDKQIIEVQAKELKEIDAIKSRFFANVSHELRTPITLIQGPIQSVLSNQNMTNRNFTLLSKAKQNTKKLLQLVNEILDLTKLDGHKLELDETSVVLYTFLRQIISNFQSVADSQSIEFIFNYRPPHTLQVKIDKSKFEKILNNLLSNAFKFTPKNGRIEIEVSDLGAESSNALDNSGILITIKDNGRGIPPEDVPNVFNRFYQSSINKKAEGGLGIGLALSMEFVKLMKGKMWAESSTDDTNHGSTFFFQFPKKEVLGMLSTQQQLLINQEETAITSNTTQNDTTKTKELVSNDETQTTILLVEDNPDLRDYISLILSPYYKVITAENGAEGLERLTDASLDGRRQTENDHQANHPSSDKGTSVNRQGEAVRQAKRPSLIISDVMMPIMDGFEFLEKVKANPEWSGLPFIMLTARAEIQTRLKALRIGVDDYLLKPFDEEELLVRIANLLANYDERQAFAQTETLDETAVILTPSISDDDQKWLITIENIILKKMNDSIFSIDYLSNVVYMNRKTFYKKLKQLTGLTPIKYIRLIRLQKAKSLLEQGKSVKEAASQVGFQKAGYFSTLFKKEFGKLPSEYFD